MAEQWSYIRPDEIEADIDRSWPTKEEAEHDLALDVAFARSRGQSAFVRSWLAGDYKLIVREVSDWKVVE
jgi:hypothetical protein